MIRRDEAIHRVRDIMGRGNLLAHGDDVRHLLAAHDEAVAERDAARAELAAMRADRDAALLILPACCGSLADAADTLRQQREGARAALRGAGTILAARVARLRAEVERVAKQRDELFRAVVRVELLREQADALPDEAYDQMDEEIEAAESDLLRIAAAIAPDFRKPADGGAEPAAGGGA